MGFNTTVLVLNDALHHIENDPEFGRKLVQAIQAVSRGSQVDISSNGHCNAATVIESHHADYDVLVKIGGNRAVVITENNQQDEIPHWIYAAPVKRKSPIKKAKKKLEKSQTEGWLDVIKGRK